MLNLSFLQQVLISSVVLSVITCTFIQKTKRFFGNKNFIMFYSLLVNLVFGILFCNSFTTVKFPDNLWISFFSFLGADNIYKSLEGKLLTYHDLTKK